MDKHRNPSISFGLNKDKQFFINSIKRAVEKSLNMSLYQLKRENAEDSLYYLALRYVTTTNKAICEAFSIPVEAGTRYKRALEKSGLLVQSIDEFICPYTFRKAHLLSTNPKEFAKLQKSNSRQLNLFEKGGDNAN
ncbi:hypothetical protein [Sphingobacterium sp. SGL-16]|uniref:hypothetical protein n=1 Tax=Sphingobacterium sp. SGL-16 TaxID=2710883 RepID=UPI0013EBC004|nr:hypothetical protein [Sphingobacterium sp. SGL-16]NGM71678.1 hypothetical protein [Sphingobacterium sp. SGL-16]